jgi:hypothetical protein
VLISERLELSIFGMGGNRWSMILMDGGDLCTVSLGICAVLTPSCIVLST